MWHAQVTSLTLRLYARPGGYDRREPFLAVAQAELLGDGAAFIHAALRADGRPVTMGQWRALARLLRAEFGVQQITGERHRRSLSLDTVRGLA